MNKEQINEALNELIKVGYMSDEYLKDKYSGQTLDEIYDIEDFFSYEIESENFKIKEKENFGGYEGAGETAWIVYEITDKKSGDTTFIRKNGYYSSWNGTEWRNGFDIVEPREVTIVEWFKSDKV